MSQHNLAHNVVSAAQPPFKVGDKAVISRIVGDADIQLFAEISGDHNPVHLDEAYAATTRFKRRIAHGMLSAAFISATLGTTLPGPGAIYLKQTLEFLAPVYLGETVTVEVTITGYDESKGKMVLSTICRTQSGAQVVNGEAVVLYRP